MLRKDCSSSSPRVGRDLGRSSHPGLTNAQLSDEWSEEGNLNADLVLPLVLCALVQFVCRKVLVK
jgi:hypothetical protein